MVRVVAMVVETEGEVKVAAEMAVEDLVAAGRVAVARVAGTPPRKPASGRTCR